jgi:hypothetical protein
MPFIVPQVCRYTIHGLFQGRQVANIIDMQIDTTGSTTTRADAIFDQCGILLNQWHTDILPLLSILYTAQNVSWVDLNSDSGTVGSRNVSGGHTWPTAGGDSLSPMPAQVAVLVRKNIDSIRGARKGRLYLAGVTEPETSSTVPNIVDPTVITTLNTKLATFLTAVNQTAGALEYTSKMAVTQILTYAPLEPGQKPPGSPATGTHHFVKSLVADNLLATQRRRLRG